jgi:hypothetical protein
MYVVRLALGRPCLKRDERTLESAQQSTRVRGPCLEFARSDSLDDPSEQLRRVTRGAVVHARECGAWVWQAHGHAV